MPLLEKSEWAEIEALFTERTDYVFRDASRESETLVVVSLARKTDQYKGLILQFSRVQNHWVEKKAAVEEVDYLIPVKKSS